MPKMTTTSLINKIFAFCEAYSGVELFPYQAQFAKRIIRSVLENDGDEITALFSRQCVQKGHKVLLANGSYKKIEKIKVGDKVRAFDYDKFVDRVVISSYSTGLRETYKLVLANGMSIRTTANHRFLDYGSRLFKQLADFEAGDMIGYKDGDRVHFSRIKSLSYIGLRETYDIEVEGAENFICDDFLVHNSGKSETVATISGGLAIILPVLANLPMFANDSRLTGFKHGMMIGIFAPTLNQAQISFNRMKKRMGSTSAEEVMSDPEIDVQFSVSNGQNIILSNGSLIRCQSASDGSNIEGDSYMMIIVDEAQDVGNFKYLKSISPMGAFYNATKILIGTSTTHKGFFFEAINRNKEEYKNGGKRNHLEYDYHTVIKYNPKYERYVEGEKKRNGEHSDEFQMAFCVSPSTKVLTSDLRWVRADSIQKGDTLVGFDEEPPKKYGQRKFSEAIVEDVGRIKRPCYKVYLSDGSSIVCSSEHQWLVFTAGSRTQWKMTKDLVSTDRIYRVCNVWDDLSHDYRLGYLSASYDGEGNLNVSDGKLNQISFAQKDNAMLDTVKEYLTDFGFKFNKLYPSTSSTGEYEPVFRLNISGGKREYLRFLGTVRPKRLLSRFNPNMLGTVRCTNGEAGDNIHPRVIGLKYLGVRDVIPIRTSTRTYIAEGLASHNCLKWILERGMFFDPKTFESMAEPSMSLSLMDTSKVHVAGIDLGKKSDSTVVTILEVDWDNPVIVEKSHSGDVDVPDYIGYNTYIKAWLELQGDDWNEQYDEIMSFLSNFNVVRVVMDGTGVGDAIYDRMRANLNIEVIPYVFSRQSKSELYKHLNTEVKGGRVHYPASPEVLETREYENFSQQCMDLEKSYSGQLMVVSHPLDVKGAHDDYPDSLALAVWGARGEGVSRPVTEKSNIHSSVKPYTRKVNRITARRRR